MQDINQRRHLLRLWLAPEDSQPLPERYAELWGVVTPGNREGIQIERFKECIPLEAEPGNLWIWPLVLMFDCVMECC